MGHLLAHGRYIYSHHAGYFAQKRKLVLLVVFLIYGMCHAAIEGVRIIYCGAHSVLVRIDIAAGFFGAAGRYRAYKRGYRPVYQCNVPPEWLLSRHEE